MKVRILTLILLCLWIPVSFDKLLNFEVFKNGILGQPFNGNIGYLLIYSLPVLEVLTAVLLVLSKLRFYGFLLSTVLMAGFTAYIGLALAGAWEMLPCGCGSVISSMSWKQHFFFNLFFFVISGYGLYITNIQRDGAVGGETAEGGPA
jgi:putative oxidoreductase